MMGVTNSQKYITVFRITEQNMRSLKKRQSERKLKVYETPFDYLLDLVKGQAVSVKVEDKFKGNIEIWSHQNKKGALKTHRLTEHALN